MVAFVGPTGAGKNDTRDFNRALLRGHEKAPSTWTDWTSGISRGIRSPEKIAFVPQEAFLFTRNGHGQHSVMDVSKRRIEVIKGGGGRRAVERVHRGDWKMVIKRKFRSVASNLSTGTAPAYLSGTGAHISDPQVLSLDRGDRQHRFPDRRGHPEGNCSAFHGSDVHRHRDHPAIDKSKNAGENHRGQRRAASSRPAPTRSY